MAEILIVDDSEMFREIIKDIFEKAGETVVGMAANGVEGVEMFMKLRPDITTMDITMPEMGGVEALRRIMEEDPDAKVIMVSSAGQEDKVNEAMILGACAFLQKPYELDKVLEAVLDVLRDIQ